jgi:transcriptional regulator with XRE-family HTH domain
MQLRSRRALADYIDLLGISERQLARSAGLSHSTVNHLVTGRRNTCSLRTAVAVERALDCPLGLLFSPDTDADRLAMYRLWADAETREECSPGSGDKEADLSR